MSEKKGSPIKIVVVIGVAAVALLAALLALFNIEASRETTKSPMQINYEQIQLKRTRELPEVVSFLRIYPNATESNSSSTASGPFVLASETHYQDKGFTQVITLTVYVRTTPSNTGSPYERQGINQPYHGYYYTTELRCHPTVNGTETGLNRTIRSASDELCEQDGARLYQIASMLSGTSPQDNDDGKSQNVTMYVGDRTSDASLPIRVVQRIELAEQTVKVRVYPIYPEWNLSDIASEDPRFGTFTDENGTRLYADFGLAQDILPFAKVTCPSANSVLVKNMNLFQPFNITLFNTLRDERNVTGIISFTDPISPYLEEERGGVNGAVFYNYRLPGVNPTASYQNGTDSYRLMFASFYDVDIRLPRNAIVTSSHVEECSFADSDHWVNREFAAMNVYDVVFSISADDARANDNNNSTASIGVNITEIPQRLAASMQGLSSADRVAVEEANKLDIVQAYLGRFPEAEVNSVQHQNMYSAGPEPIGAIHTISYSYGYADETSKFRHFRSLHVTLIEEAGQSMPARTSLACGSSLGGSALAQLNSVNSTEQVKTLCPLPYE